MTFHLIFKIKDFCDSFLGRHVNFATFREDKLDVKAQVGLGEGGGICYCKKTFLVSSSQP